MSEPLTPEERKVLAGIRTDINDGRYDAIRVSDAAVLIDIIDRLATLDAARAQPAASEGLDEGEIGVLLKALTIGRISWDGDGWFAANAGYGYDEAGSALAAASVLVTSKARAALAASPSSDTHPEPFEMDTETRHLREQERA